MTISTTTLKNAAFAIECDLWTDPATGANYLAKDGAILRRWEPEHDDGDALRLAVKLRFEIQCYPSMGGVIYDDGSPDGGYVQQNPEKGQSDEQAVRFAIVRAAAIMGEALKCQ